MIAPNERRTAPPANPRLSLLVAEALVERQGTRQIKHRARHLGLPSQWTEVLLATCCCSSDESSFVTGRPTRELRVNYRL